MFFGCRCYFWFRFGEHLIQCVFSPLAVSLRLLLRTVWSEVFGLLVSDVTLIFFSFFSFLLHTHTHTCTRTQIDKTRRMLNQIKYRHSICVRLNVEININWKQVDRWICSIWWIFREVGLKSKFDSIFSASERTSTSVDSIREWL